MCIKRKIALLFFLGGEGEDVVLLSWSLALKFRKISFPRTQAAQLLRRFSFTTYRCWVLGCTTRADFHTMNELGSNLISLSNELLVQWSVGWHGLESSSDSVLFILPPVGTRGTGNEIKAPGQLLKYQNTILLSVISQNSQLGIHCSLW